jgi:hypothetical protein
VLGVVPFCTVLEFSGNKGRMAAGRSPVRVLWRWKQVNMPRAWDLDLVLPEGSGDAECQVMCMHAAPAAAVCGCRPVREGLAVILRASEWWQTLVSNSIMLSTVTWLCTCMG